MILSLFLVGFYNQSLLSSLAVNSYIISCIFLRNVCCDFFLSGVPKFCFYAEQIFGNLSVNNFFSWEFFSRFIPTAVQLRCQITLFYNVEISLVTVEIRFILQKAPVLQTVRDGTKNVNLKVNLFLKYLLLMFYTFVICYFYLRLIKLS